MVVVKGVQVVVLVVPRERGELHTEVQPAERRSKDNENLDQHQCPDVG